MMKVDPRAIVHAHIETLKDLESSEISVGDLITFYIIPVFLCLLTALFDLHVDDEVFSLSVSVFSIFSALLLSVQVAMYGVFKSDGPKYQDQILKLEARQRKENARILLREINANVSYLTLISCTAVTVFMVFFAVDFPTRFETAILVLVYSHFLLTIAMVVKRAHEVFDAEYSAPLE